MNPNYNEIAMFCDLLEFIPDSARPLAKEYCRVTSEMISRNALNSGVEFETDSESKNNYRSINTETLAARSKELFKIIYLRYGHHRNSKNHPQI